VKLTASAILLAESITGATCLGHELSKIMEEKLISSGVTHK